LVYQGPSAMLASAAAPATAEAADEPRRKIRKNPQKRGAH